MHELVVSQPGKRPPHPDEKKGETNSFYHKPYRRRKQRSMPPSEKKSCRQSAKDYDVYIFPHKEEAEPHPGIFGMEARHQFTLRFRQIERYPLALRCYADQENHEGHRLVNYEPEAGLRCYNV